MTPVCPFVKAARPDDASSKRTENQSKHPGECPFAKGARPDDASSKRSENQSKHSEEHESKAKNETQTSDSAFVEAKCPFGYDSRSFKLGPLSCIICHALLFESSKCVPCSHVFCKACISRFNDCPLCGADIEKIEPDNDLQKVVDRFIDGHARIKRSHASTDSEEAVSDNKPVIYEDVSLERGAFLVHHAMRAFRARNIESAKSRLSLCVMDIREQLETSPNSPELCSQLGAVLGTLGDCCRAMGDSGSAITYFEESVEALSRLPTEDMEIIHTLCVSLNKIGDLKYYDGDLEASKSYYSRSLEFRRNAMKSHSDSPSLTLDIAVSLAKVADVDRGLEDEKGAIAGFSEAVSLLESLKISADDAALVQRRQSVLEFLNSQIGEKQADKAT